MSRKEKAIYRFLAMPKDYTFRELVTFLAYFEYSIQQGSGSRVSFYRQTDKKAIIVAHTPHGKKECALPEYILKQIRAKLEEGGDLDG